jgi:hypothetical protein
MAASKSTPAVILLQAVAGCELCGQCLDPVFLSHCPVSLPCLTACLTALSHCPVSLPCLTAITHGFMAHALPLQDLMHRFTFDTFCIIGFGHDPCCLDQEEAVEFAKAFDRVQAQVGG